VRQKFVYYEFDLDKQWKEFKHLDPEKYFTPALDAFGKPRAHSKLVETNMDHDIVPWIASREPNIRPFKLEEYIQKRTSQINQIYQFRMTIQVSGDPRRKLGQVIYMDLPQVCGDVSDLRPQEPDKYFSGNYLITSIVHTFTSHAYSMELEIMKDAYQNPIEHIDPLAKYRDIY
jgi:hypothetical protein